MQHPQSRDGLIGPPPQPGARRGRLAMRLRNSFLTGLVIAAPLAITAYLTWWFVALVDAWVKPLLPARYLPDSYLPFAVPGVGLLVALVSITLLGALTANLAGRTVVSWGELMLDRMPLVRSLYRVLKQIFETVLSQTGNSFQKVGLIRFPRDDTWSLVFVATQTEGEIPARVSEGTEMLSVFLPCTPNPTTGFLMFMPKAEVVILDMTVEEAAKLVISGGLVSPPYLQGVEVLQAARERWPADARERSAG